ncbi:MAG: class I SAM-dependent methyltransferase [Flavobacteriaceae bacterium]|nr:class I SAM-dependent methyltransferase [Flavobacteriaceae bacterium]
MSENTSSIHEFDLNLICEYFSNFKRQGPGSPEVTLKALSFIESLPPDARIVDIGCGTGGQTMVLAQHVTGSITGIDFFPAFIELFNQNAQDLQLRDRVQGEVGNMEDLHFDESSLDLIWSEGAIYNIGFEKGLQYWYKFLKTGGYIAVSEASWLTDERPLEIEQFWQDAYPGIDTISSKVGQMQQAGYVPIAAFILPENCWTEHYYKPQAEIQDVFLKKHASNPMVAGFIANERHEALLYEQYKAYYGYVFYIGKKI